MNTKLLMMASSITTGLCGIAASFFPQETLKNIGVPPSELVILFVQITGALYLGFAVMNWMTRAFVIGGIYARPLCMGNFLHFMVAAIALIKAARNNLGSPYIWIGAIVYSLFAVLFAIVFYTSPVKNKV